MAYEGLFRLAIPPCRSCMAWHLRLILDQLQRISARRCHRLQCDDMMFAIDLDGDVYRRDHEYQQNR